MWRPIATIAAAARDVELEEPVLKLSGYSINVNLVAPGKSWVSAADVDREI